MRYFTGIYKHPDHRYVKFDSLGRRGIAVQMIAGKERHESRICHSLKSALIVDGCKEITRAEATVLGGGKP